MMISTGKIKHLQSLRQKKFRDLHGVFLAEGEKIAGELIESDWPVEAVYALPDWIEQQGGRIPDHIACHAVNRKELERISGQKTPNRVLAVLRKPGEPFSFDIFSEDLVLMLDRIQDPGNLGTIIRTADWFGIRHLVCSPDTADVFNPKVIQASMGSFLRVKVYYQTLTDVLTKLSGRIPVYGTFREGKNLYEEAVTIPSVVIIGNESQGIRPELAAFADHPVSIPSGGSGTGGGRAESLNAAVAAGIIMAYSRNTNFRK